MKTFATIHFTNGQVVRTEIKPSKEFDAYCKLAAGPSVRKVEIRPIARKVEINAG